MEQGAEEVCVDVEYCVILNEDAAGGRVDTAGSALQGAKTNKSSYAVSPDDHLGGVDDPLKAPNEQQVENTTSHVMVLIDDDGKLAAGGRDCIGVGGGKEKRKKLAASSAKKPPPHRSGGGDATDHHQKKLMMINKELAELAMIKRARIERMKALLMQKNSANSSSKNSSSSSLFAMLFTILVFLVLLFQGMWSCQISCGTLIRGTTDEANYESGFIFIQEELNPSAAHHSAV